VLALRGANRESLLVLTLSIGERCRRSPPGPDDPGENVIPILIRVGVSPIGEHILLSARVRPDYPGRTSPRNIIVTRVPRVTTT